MINNLFLNEIIDACTFKALEMGYLGQNNHDVIQDPYSNYKFNSKGYRSKEFVNNEEMVIAGCSFSFGVGVAEEMIWGVQVANHFGFSYSNLSVPGISPAHMVYNLFAYFKKYGNPKYLIILCPDYYRLTLPSISNKFTIEKHMNEDTDAMHIEAAHLYYKKDNNNVAKYSKSPHIIENVIPIEVPEWINIKQLQILEQYCNAAGIKLIWSLWDRVCLNQTFEANNKNINLFKYLIDSGVREWDKDDLNNDIYFEECHEYLRDLYPNTFDIGGDIQYGRKTAHFGVHKHTHIAEKFIKHIENNWDI